MAKFKFKLVSVLNHRKSREELVLGALARAQQSLQAARDHRDRLGRELEDSLKRRERLGSQAVGITAFHIEQSYISGTKARIIQAEGGIARAQRGVEKAMRAYLAARRQTRSIEMLKEKQYAEFKLDRSRREQKELDDQVLMRLRLNDERGEEGGAA